MIRRATRSDLSAVQELVMDFLSNTAYNEHVSSVDPEHIKKLLYAVLNVGYVWLYETKDYEPAGVLIAVVEPNVWIPTKTSLREIIWYVKPEYRTSPSAAKLFLEFCREGEKLLVSKTIQGYFTTRMSSTTSYDLSKRGFREVETLFLKDM
jgi:hypothetical protein